MPTSKKHQITSLSVLVCQSPLFLLFLDTTWQLLEQYPAAFEFSETYLTVLCDSTRISLFGTFLFNSPHQRVKQSTVSDMLLFVCMCMFILCVVCRYACPQVCAGVCECEGLKLMSSAFLSAFHSVFLRKVCYRTWSCRFWLFQLANLAQELCVSPEFWDHRLPPYLPCFSMGSWDPNSGSKLAQPVLYAISPVSPLPPFLQL